MQRFYDESKEAALLAVDSSPQGLTQAEAQARLERNGKNQLARGKKGQPSEALFPPVGRSHDPHFAGGGRH